MPFHLLSDVDVVAVSIVKNGANRKRIYLRKSEEVADKPVFDLPVQRVIKEGTDWSVFYTVVAEPDALESPGVGSPGVTIEDQWASADEIRKAAHRFMKNGGLVNRMHETLEPYGTVVENFVAQADFQVGDEVIKAGSWVIGIEPTEEGRELVESGEFSGVSIQGTGTRTLAKEKGFEGDAKKCPHCKSAVAGDRKTCQNCGHSFKVEKSHVGENVGGPIRHLIAHYMKKKHPFRACVRDNRKRFPGPGQAESVCATLKDMGRGTHGWRNSSGLKKELELDETFLAQAEANWLASGLTEEDAKVALDMALESEDRSLLTKIADKLGISAEDEHLEDDVALTDEQKAQLEKVATLEAGLTEITKDDGRLASIEQSLAGIAAKLDAKGEEEKSDEEKRTELEATVAKLDQDLQKAQEDLDALAEGSSNQDKRGNENVQKEDPDAALAAALFG